MWALRVDVHVLDHDGNLADAANLAVLSALLDFRRPDFGVSEDGSVTIYPIYERNPVRLTIHYQPICVSFVLFDAVLVVDPSRLEELVADGTMLLVLTRQGDVVCSIKSGGGTLTPACLTEEGIRVAQRAAIVYSDLIRGSLRSSGSSK